MPLKNVFIGRVHKSKDSIQSVSNRFRGRSMTNAFSLNFLFINDTLA